MFCFTSSGSAVNVARHALLTGKELSGFGHCTRCSKKNVAQRRGVSRFTS
jgi:hypothetical protein